MLDAATQLTFGPMPEAAAQLGIQARQRRVWVRQFGRLRLFVDFQEVPPARWPYPKVAALLRLLLLQPGDLPLEQITSHLWPKLSPARARQNFAVALHHLRRVLEPSLDKPQQSQYVIYRNQRVRLEHARILSDRDLFERLWQQAQALERAGPSNGDHDQAAGTYWQLMVSLYAGPLFEDEPELAACREPRERLAHMYLRAREGLARLAFQAGDYWGCIHHAKEGLQADVLHEPLHVLMMEAYCKLGQPSRAILHYQDLRRLLERTSGTAPSPAVHSLYLHLLNT